VLGPSRDLRQIAEAVEIRGVDEFSVCGERFDVDLTTGDLVSSLTSRVYQLLYCRPRRDHVLYPLDSRATRVFVDELSRANEGNGTWDPNWQVRAIEDNGTLVVHKAAGDLTVWAHPDQFRALTGLTIGCTGQLRVGKELRHMLPGYYLVLGDADRSQDRDQAAVVRLYWHLTAAGASCWIQQLTRRFNRAGVRFHAKVLIDPNGYNRADAGVVYVESADVECAMTLLPGLHESVSEFVLATTPMFTRRLARGVAAAEDPGDGRSFGQHRCRLVAEALVSAFEAGRSEIDQLVDSVSSRFAREGLDTDRPWLNPGSHATYVLPRRRPVGGSSAQRPVD
jgi:hypothetical protein